MASKMTRPYEYCVRRKGDRWMSVFVFKVKLAVLYDFVDRLKANQMQFIMQKTMLRQYAQDLNLKLTEKMIIELLT